MPSFATIYGWEVGFNFYSDVSTFDSDLIMLASETVEISLSKFIFKILQNDR